jgi:hypothetical protein
MRNALHEVGGRSLGIDASAESASSQRNSHTLLFFTHTQYFITLKDKENTSSFLGKVVGNDGRVFFTFFHLFL